MKTLKTKTMKKIISLLVLITTSIVSNAQTLTFKPTTGDKELNTVLTDVNNKAIKDISAFKKDVNTSFNIAESVIDKALKILAPGDVFMAAQLSITANKPFNDVVTIYQKDKAKGWGVIAKELGIKPGSPEFHAMKKAMKSKGNPSESSKSNGHGNSQKDNKGKGKKK